MSVDSTETKHVSFFYDTLVSKYAGADIFLKNTNILLLFFTSILLDILGYLRICMPS